MQAIAVSGCDQVGKTQQLRLLRYDDGEKLHFTRKLADYSPRWPRLTPAEDFEWWFHGVSLAELISIIGESLNQRHLDVVEGKTSVHDRGTGMFLLVCAATIMTREGVTADEALTKAGTALQSLLRYEPEPELYLTVDAPYRAQIRPLLDFVDARSGNFTAEQNDLYSQYQANLAELLRIRCENAAIRTLLVDRCILEVQNQLRAVLAEMTGAPVVPLCPNLEQVVAFGGMSECGKGTFAAALEVDGYYRLKLKYFDRVIEGRGERADAQRMGLELLNFLHCHQHLRRVTVESLHGPKLPAFIKLLLGGRSKVVYLDTPEELRIARTAGEHGLTMSEARRLVLAKDAGKRLEGAHQVRDVADIVYANDSDTASASVAGLLPML